MNVIVMQNTVYKGKRYLAGATVPLDDVTAERWIAKNLAYCVETPETAPTPPEAVAPGKETEKPVIAVKTPEKAKKTASKAKGGKKK